MRMSVHLGGNDWGGGLTEVLGGFLGILGVLTNVGCEPWCIRVLCRAWVAAILSWATASSGTIGGLAWTCVGLHALHALPVPHNCAYCTCCHKPTIKVFIMVLFNQDMDGRLKLGLTSLTKDIFSNYMSCGVSKNIWVL